MEHEIADPVGPRHVVVTGASGQLGRALGEAFPDALAFTRADWDVTQLPPRALLGPLQPSLVLHAAAWTGVDAAEDDPAGAEAVNVVGTRNAVLIGAPLVYYSTDYVFDGTKGLPYVESDEPNPISVYGRTKLDGEQEVRDGWIVRSAWLFGATRHNFVRTMLRLGRERDEVAVVDDQRGSPTYVGHLAAATRELVELPHGVYHVAADGDCTWAEFAGAIFDEAGLSCRVRRITAAEWGAPAPRPANSVLRSEKPETPRLPHWRDGLRECLERIVDEPH
ncbi:MAG TPA: dTDP-4-dehydrorhamnose reductase [Gaiellaceae bacterium]|nr:dTDP-4-dehydrorhamnose reductase [Gaiellaceae bacterium]